MTERLTCGADHIGLTVPDLDAARQFFTQALGFDVVGGRPDYPAVFVSDGSITVTLWRALDPANAAPFDRKAHIGLHHLALRVVDDAALVKVYDRVRAHPSVTIEFAPIPVRPESAIRHFMFAMPGGIRIEMRGAAA